VTVVTHWAAPAVLAALGAIAALVFDALKARRAAGASVIAFSLAASVAVLAGGLSGAAQAIALLLGVLGAAAVAGGWRDVADSERGGLTAALSGFSIAFSLLAVASPDIVTLVLSLEGMALSSYGLVSRAGTDRSREAAMKYFVQGAVATAMLIVAAAVMLAGSGGEVDMSVLVTFGGSSGGSVVPVGAALLAWVFIAASVGLKAGAFPFHSWAPDAYETARPATAGLLASVPKAAAVVVLAAWVGARIAVAQPGEPGSVAVIAAGLAAGSIVFGNLVALRQRSFRRMLAYSGIAQVGYALVGIVSGQPWTALALMMVYAPAALGAFLVADEIERERPGWDGSIAGLAGIARERPALGVALAVLMFSLTGVPLLAGFWGKLLVFATAASSGWLWLALLGAVGSVVSFGYYGSVLKAAYMSDDPDREGERRSSSPAGVTAMALAVLVVAGGVAPLAMGIRDLVNLLAR
jgi:NADH-quinone oxidoreductase subunit N